MRYENSYGIRFAPNERQMLREVARWLERKDSEAVRFLVRRAFEALKEQEAEQENKVEAQ